jgi:hypothetical protein
MKRKAFEEIPGPSTKKGRRYPEPIHERRLFVKATVIWTSLKGEIKTLEGMFLADSGCSGATMNKTVVNRERMTVIKRAEAIFISTADGSEMKKAGIDYTQPYCHGVGRDINVQCVLIKEMIIIVDHYTLAVRNRR